MKTLLFLSAALSLFLNCASSMGQSLVDDYWPLNDGDLKRYVDDRGHLLREGVADLGDGDFKVVWISDDQFGYQLQRRVPSGVMLKHDEDNSDSVDYDPPIILINEDLLQAGGSVRSDTTVRGHYDYDATYKVEVSSAGNVRVKAGVFQDCRNIKVTELQRFMGRNVETWKYQAVLAPHVGIIKYKLGGKWWELINGIVGGVNVENYTMFTSMVTIQISGNGSVTPNYNGHNLYVGSHYNLRATPASGYVFAGWTDLSGNTLGTDRSLQFQMQSNLVIQAVFVPTPYLAVKGNYSGLFYNSSQIAQVSSGAFSGKLTENGALSGKVTLGNGQTYPFSGAFTTNLTCYAAITRHGMSSLILNLELDTNSAAITGSISAEWSSGVTALRTAASGPVPAAQAGKRYTLAIPGGVDPANAPAGFGYGSAKVSSTGNVAFSGVLSDGMAVSQSAYISGDGAWPVFVPTCGGKGLLFGWLQFQSSETSDLGGSLSWFKQPRPGLYPAGFAFTNLEAFGSEYVANQPVVWNLGTAVFGGGNTSEQVTSMFTMTANGRGSGTNRLSVAITPATGIFKGSILHPETGKTVRFGGAYLQKLKTGYGSFQGKTESGSAVVAAQQ